MKRFAERHPGARPYRGYVSQCRRCGALVVHADKTNEPLHMHLRSKKCRKMALARAT